MGVVSQQLRFRLELAKTKSTCRASETGGNTMVNKLHLLIR